MATVVASLLGDRNLVSSIVFALCNAGEALLTAGIIERYFGSPFSLDRLRHVLGLLSAAVVATAVSGIGGALGFALFHDASAPIFVTWQNWFASDALGIITIAPLVIGLASAAREPPAQRETIEGLPKPVFRSAVQCSAVQCSAKLIGARHAPAIFPWSRWCDTRKRKGETTGNTNVDLNRRASPRPYLGEPGGESPPGLLVISLGGDRGRGRSMSAYLRSCRNFVHRSERRQVADQAECIAIAGAIAHQSTSRRVLAKRVNAVVGRGSRPP